MFVRTNLAQSGGLSLACQLALWFTANKDKFNSTMKFHKLLILLILIPSTSYSKNSYSWKVKRVIDGDTLEIEQNFMPDNLKLKIRILGIDTPEKGWRAKCAKEKILAKKAFDFMQESITNAQNNNIPITFSNLKWGKYGGRLLATVTINNKNLSTELINRGLAKEYHGKKKESWCK